MITSMRKALVLATALALAPAAAAGTSATLPVAGLLRIASALTGVAPAKDVSVAVVPQATLRTRAIAVLDRTYPRDLQAYDERLYRSLGLLGPTQQLRPALVRAYADPARIVYDPASRTVSVPAGPAARSRAVEGLVRLLQDGVYGVTKRVAAVREDSDATLSAGAAAAGAAALTVRSLRAATDSAPAPRTRIDAFVGLESEFPGAVGTRLAANLYNVGGTAAVRSLLGRLPVSSEQVFHVDKYLARERPSPIELPGLAGGLDLVRTDTFGELDVRALLAVFEVPRLDRAGTGWGAGASAYYRDATGHDATVLRLDWDSERDAQEWQEAVVTYVNEAFDGEIPGAPATTPCQADLCWALGARSIAFTLEGTRTAVVFAPTVAAASSVGNDLVPRP
jgi:hypothetical protein